MEEAYEKRGYLLEDFRLFHLKDDRGTNVDYHYHDFYKLVFLLSGNGSYVVEGRRYLLAPGDIVLIGNHVVHKPEFLPGVSYERVILYISPDFLSASAAEDYSPEECFSGQNGHVLRPTEEFRRHFLTLMLQLEAEMGGTLPGRILLSRCFLLRALVEVTRELNGAESQRPGPVVPKDSKVLDILRYLDENLTEDISIDDLSNRFFISKYHMMRRFREETGTSIHTYLSEKRLFLARDRIQNGESATEACFGSGFRSYSAFSRAYGKLFGATPTGRGAAVQAMPADADE